MANIESADELRRRGIPIPVKGPYEAWQTEKARVKVKKC